MDLLDIQERIDVENDRLKRIYDLDYESLFFHRATREDLDRYEVNEFLRWGV